jgi:subtilisin family serine protease
MKLIYFILLFVSSSGFAQVEDAWVYFKDKPSSSTYLNTPLLMLSQRSIDRRTAQDISLDIKDVPVEANYIFEVSRATGITIKAKSKWLNALHVQGEQSDIESLIELFSVAFIQFKNSALNKSVSKKIDNKFQLEKITAISELDYGATENQTIMLHGDFLHDLGFTGSGLQIAVLDAGFKGVESFTAFANLHDSDISNGEILGGYDFVNRSTSYYTNTGSTHGLSVLSTISGYINNQFIGTAPDAQFYLFVTEDAGSETPLEESLWVEAAEIADSLGVDVINTSLGYTTFDDSSYNYSYADMDGETAFISRGAEVACSRGMILVTSAGNEGSRSWKYISAPADAVSVLTVGAVNENEVIASFSSFGPTADNRIKPDVLAQGQNVYVINSSGNISTSNGTSFSGPVMAGMVACLWQAFPNKTANEIKQLIVASSDLYSTPTTQRGYGVPDFESIYNLLSVDRFEDSEVLVYPNPVTDKLYIHLNKEDQYLSIRIVDLLGKLVFENKKVVSNTAIDVSFLKDGMYIVEINSKEKLTILKIIKK